MQQIFRHTGMLWVFLLSASSKKSSLMLPAPTLSSISHKIPMKQSYEYAIVFGIVFQMHKPDSYRAARVTCAITNVFLSTTNLQPFWFVEVADV